MRTGSLAAAAALFLGIVLAIAVLPTGASAHGSGLTFTATTTDFYVDIDYETFVIESGEPGRFDFKLFKDPERLHSAEFTQVWTRIKRDDGSKTGETLFSGWIADALFGSTGLTYSFAESGEYTLVVRYQNGDDELVETSFLLNVVPGVKEQSFAYDREFFVGILAGSCAVLIAALAFIFRKRLIPRGK